MQLQTKLALFPLERHCRHCGRPLTAPKSRAKGIGAVCEKRRKRKPTRISRLCEKYVEDLQSERVRQIKQHAINKLRRVLGAEKYRESLSD